MNMVKKILIAPSSFAAADVAPLNMIREKGFEPVLNPFKRKLAKPETLSLLDGVCGLLAGLETLDEEVMTLSSLKVISRVGAGMSNVDLDAARHLGIRVFSTPDAPTSAVAELTVGAMLGLLRNIHAMNSELHEGRWQKMMGAQLEGKTVVVVGYGRIGRRVAALVKAFGARIVCVDPVIAQGTDGMQVLPLEKALAAADLVTCHVSGEKEILGDKEFALMKPGALVLNASRGGVVNEEALIRALDEKKVAGAWLDTFTQEPYQGPLSKYPQVILTPHVGSLTVECRQRMEMEAVENLFRGLEESGINGRH